MGNLIHLPKQVYAGRRRRQTQQNIDSGWDNEVRHVCYSRLIQSDRGTVWRSMPGTVVDDAYHGSDPEDY